MLSSLKSELRKKYLKERKAMSSEDVAFLSEKIFNQYLLQFNVSENQNIHIFCQYLLKMRLIPICGLITSGRRMLMSLFLRW